MKDIDTVEPTLNGHAATATIGLASGQESAQQGAACSDRAVAYCALGLGAFAVAGATAVGLRWAARPAAVRSISMGPGGWVSFKGVKQPHPAGPRPWWAVLLRARPVEAHGRGCA
jgi:hypothetical protein